MSKKSTLLSKTKIKNNDICDLRLFLELNHPESQNISKGLQNAFDIGNVVDKKAKSLFPNGIEVLSQSNIDRANETIRLIKAGKEVIFEASFIGDGTAVRCDIFVKKEDQTWKMIEIKSGAKLKDDYIDDAIIQYYVLESSGVVKVSEVEVWHLNNKQYNEKDIFVKNNMMSYIESGKDRYNLLLSKAKNTLNLAKTNPPKKELGSKCKDCPMQKACWGNSINDPRSVLTLPAFDKRWDAYNKGIDSIDHPLFEKEYGDWISKNQLRYESIKENKLLIDIDGIKKELSSWKFPMKFLDFETINPPIPVVTGYKPYENALIQYSLSTLNEDKTRTHSDFLHSDLNDPSLIVGQKLSADLAQSETIVVYSKTFENTQINSLIKKIPDENVKTSLKSIGPKFVDLLEVIEKYIYHPLFLGKFSLKTVTPVLLNNSGYQDSFIKDGSEINKYFLEYLTTTNLERKNFLEVSLKSYCQKDTEFLVDLFIWIWDKINEKN